MLAKDPDCPGSLGLAISEAVDMSRSRGQLSGRSFERRNAPNGDRILGDQRLSDRSLVCPSRPKQIQGSPLPGFLLGIGTGHA